MPNNPDRNTNPVLDETISTQEYWATSHPSWNKPTGICDQCGELIRHDRQLPDYMKDLEYHEGDDDYHSNDDYCFECLLERYKETQDCCTNCHRNGFGRH